MIGCEDFLEEPQTVPNDKNLGAGLKNNSRFVTGKRGKMKMVCEGLLISQPSCKLSDSNSQGLQNVMRLHTEQYTSQYFKYGSIKRCRGNTIPDWWAIS